MSSSKIALKPVDRLEITTVINNYADLLLKDKEGVVRGPQHDGQRMLDDTLLAEHGLCLWLDLFQGGEKTSVLLDAGYSRVAVLHNLDILGLDPGDLSAIAVSHGHLDHTGSLMAVLDRIDHPVSLTFHPDAYLTRAIENPDGTRIESPSNLEGGALEAAGAELLVAEGPVALAGGGLFTTGTIPRETDFEVVRTSFKIYREGRVMTDPINDDQSLMVHVKGRGLALISGCAHAGIINSVEYARRLSGVERVAAVIGGFHLTGAEEYALRSTLDRLKAYSPDLVMAMHCTGREAECALAAEMPEAFVLNCVGTKVVLGA